ncbi:LCP family protein [Nocardioides sp. zg-DK7169]|uniref:LCP family protein n=1 Tax=Nocardioides sp. zg-DK7169 TaxID=2736600 RepID=UPI003463893E
MRFRRAVALMVMTLLVPGSAQLLHGNRRVGLIAIRVWLGSILALVLIALASLVRHQVAFQLASDANFLLLLRLFLMAGAVGWAVLFMDAWRIGQPLTLGLVQRRAAIGVNGFLSLAVAGVLLFGSHLVGVQRDLMVTMFNATEVKGAHDGRFNIALFGGDAGAGRWGLRPDSINVASVDASTGRTVLISLPRNLQDFPFAPGSVMDEQFPEGFDCDGCYLNGVSTWAQDNPELFGDSENPGIDATLMAIEGVTGLEMNYWAMANLEGFKDLVDAVGGITLNVREPIPVGGLGDDVTGYLEPGVRKLDGFETLWYARAREGSDDYSRMARQKCVLNAMLGQVSPQTAVTNFGSIAEASSDMVSTNLPASQVGRFVELALKAKGQKMSTVSLVPPLINTADPDIELMHRKVAEAIAKAEGTFKAPEKAAVSAGGTTGGSSGAGAGTSSPVTGGSLGSLSEGYLANQADDLGSAC